MKTVLLGSTLGRLIRRGMAAITPAQKLAGSAGAGPRSVNLFEQVEPRILLGGDHPSLPDYQSATQIVLNGATGIGSLNTPTPGSPIRGTITAGDDDVFRFTALRTDFVSILADTANEVSSNLDTRLIVFTESNGAPVTLLDARNNGVLTSGPARDAWAGFIAQVGVTYYLRVMADGGALDNPGTSIGSYTLQVDTFSTNVTPDVGTGAFDQAGTLGRRQEDIVYRMLTPNTAAFNSLITVIAQATDGPDPGPEPDLDTRVEIFSSTGVLLASDSDAGRLTNAFATLRGRQDTAYFIRVRSDQIAAGTPSVGNFILTVDAAATNIALDPVTRRGFAPGVLPNSRVAGLYSFTAQGTGQAFITARGVPLPPLADPALRIYRDSDGLQVGFNDDFNGAIPEIQYPVSGQERYFLVVESFDAAAGGAFRVWVEANATLDSPNIDDHVNADLSGSLDDIRRRFEQATTLVFGPADQVRHPFYGNPITDMGWAKRTTGVGRIQGGTDSDLFQFTAPFDMLGTYGGVNTDAGVAIFAGGAFSTAGGSTPNSPTVQRATSASIASFGAGDWWNTGLGLTRDDETPGIVYGMVVYDVDGGGPELPALYVVGDFTRAPDGDAFIETPGIARWRFDPLATNENGSSGDYRWEEIPDAPAGIGRAIIVYDPPDVQGAPPSPPRIVVGFQNAAGTAGEVASWGPATAGALPTWGVIAGVFNGPVRALGTYDYPDPDGTGPLTDEGAQVFVGGSFTTVNGSPANNVAEFRMTRTGDAAWRPLQGGTNGPVNALITFDPPDPDGDGPAPDPDPILVVAGEFTSVTGTISTNQPPGALPNPQPQTLARQRLAAWNGVTSFRARFEPPPPGTPSDQDYALNAWAGFNFGGGPNGPILALALYDVDRGGPQEQSLIIGGNFTTLGGPAGNIGRFYTGFGTFGAGFNAPVRALLSTADDDLGVPDGDEAVLYAAGDFTVANPGLPPLLGGNLGVGRIAKWVDYDPLVPQQWQQLRFQTGSFLGADPGANASIHSLAAFRDLNPNTWDRNAKPANRLGIVVSGTQESFLNAFVRVYDSNFNLIYQNDTIAPPFPDPAGAFDPATTAPGVPGELTGPTLWGGETYYVEVTSATGALTGTGRYNLSLVLTNPASPGNNRTYVDNSVLVNFGPNDAGFWTGVPALGMSPAGDSRNFAGSGSPPLRGNYVGQRAPVFGRDGVAFAGDLGHIIDVNDVELFQFRPTNNGPVEIRINTTNLNDEFGEQIGDTFNGLTKTYSSQFDSAIRIFNNDLQQIAYNDDNIAISTEFQETTVGTLGDSRRFFRRDARVVFNAVAGQVYFIQVESGQRWVDGSPADPAQRVPVTDDQRDRRREYGSYELLVNSVGNLGFIDDHSTSTIQGLPQATPIDIAANGSGQIGGVIRNVAPSPGNPGIPQDDDVFFFFPVSRGTNTVTLTRLSENLVPAIEIFNAAGEVIAFSSAVAGAQSTTVTISGNAGDRFFVRARGAGGTEGEYRLTIAGPGYSDDHSNARPWLATEATINDFLGNAVVAGNIETAGDVDMFRFIPLVNGPVTVTVNKVDPTLNPTVRVYEVSVDGNGNPILLTLAFNDNVTTTNTDSQVRVSVNLGRTTGDPARTFPFYYVLVQGADPATDSGRYTLTISGSSTDDHPDDGEFNLATLIAIDPSLGTGTDTGLLELDADTDLFRFTAAAGGPAIITITTPASLLNPSVIIRDAQGNQLVTANDAFSGTVTVSLTVTRGADYFIVVGNTPGGTLTGDYSVAIEGPTVDDHPNVGEFGIATQITLSSVTGDGFASGSIETRLDSDLFRFRTITGGTVRVSINTATTTAATRLRIFDSTGTLLTTVAASSLGQSISADITGALANVTYFILVDLTSLPGSTTTGSYGVTVDGPVPPPIDNDEDDHPNAGRFDDLTERDRILVSTLTGDGSISARIETAGDTDLFFFDSIAPGRAFLQIVTPQGLTLDLAVRIFDSNRQQIAFDSAGVAGANANVTFTIGGVGQRFFVLAEGLSTGTGQYTIRLDTDPVTHTIYYPEGFVNSNIREYVSMANPNAFEVSFTVILRYETGERDFVLSRGTIPANSRGGVTLSDGPGGLAPGIRADAPYAIVVESTGRLGATLAHYDFGFSLGETFTGDTSTNWSFARVEKRPGEIFDFVVLYNPNPTDIVVTLTAYANGQTPIVITTIVGAFRRGGWNLNETPQLPNGAYGITLTSRAANPSDAHIGIVASVSSYNISQGAGFAALGDAAGGHTVGVIPSLTQGGDISSRFSFFNPTSTPVQVQITGTYIRANLPQLIRTINVPAQGLVTLNGADLTFVPNQPIGIRYTSPSPISVLFTENRVGDAAGSSAATQAAQGFFFGDAFINTAEAGRLYLETLTFYNPGGQTLPVSVRLLFTDGTFGQTIVTVGAGGFAQLDLHTSSIILNRPGLNFFSIEVLSPGPIVAYMTHYDLFLNGGWGSIGSPLGLSNPLASIS